jgi:RNA polymerase subunit RPABC4/transcription elongation factor Spt4
LEHRDIPFHPLDRGWQCSKCGNVISPAQIVCPICRLKEETDPFKKRIVCYTDIPEVTEVTDIRDCSDIKDIKKRRVHFIA